jgi:octopine/nopaline transport system permease protein
MPRGLMLRRIIGPRLLHYALPGLGNIWQQVLKESALISVTGLVELMRQVNIGAGSTGQPFVFYLAGFALYLLLTTASGGLLRAAEVRSARGQRRV